MCGDSERVLVPVCSSWMNRAEGPAEECPGDPAHRRHKQKPKGPQGEWDWDNRVWPSLRVCVSVNSQCARGRKKVCVSLDAYVFSCVSVSKKEPERSEER